MGEFFTGWRRKISLIMLAMASMFMAGWVRSFTYCDHVLFASRGRTEQTLALLDGLIIWGADDDVSDPLSSYPEWETDSSLFIREMFFNRFKIDWQWYGLGSCNHHYNDGSLAKIWLIPCWFFISPLTVVSAFLLLSKPRKSSQTRLTEPVTIEGA